MKNAFNDDIEEITTPKKLTKIVSLIASLTSLVLSGVCYWLLSFDFQIPIIFAIFSVLNLMAYLVFRVTENLKIVYLLNSSLVFVSAFAICIFSGGIQSTFIIFLPVVVISGYSMTMRYGNTWFLVSLISFVILYSIDEGFTNQVNAVSVESSEIFSLISILLATVMLCGIYGRYLSNSIYKSLKKTKEIKVKNLEKETLIKEVQYRVQNNLEIIKNMLSLQSSYTSDESVKKHFIFSEYRVNAMEMIHKMLYSSENVSKINFRKYVHELSLYLIKSLRRETNEIEIQILSEDIFFNMDTAVPLGLLTNEILTNTFKYSLENRKGAVSIKLEQLNYPNFILEIGDDGIGFSEELKFDTVGYTLIGDLAGQLSGHIEKDTYKLGANFTVVFQEIESRVG